MAKRRKKAATVPRRRRFNRRYLFAAIGVVILVFAGAHIVHGSSPSPSKKNDLHVAAKTTICALTKTRGKHHSPARCTLRKPPQPKLSPVQRYARTLLPIANRSRRYFDSVAYATSIASLGNLEGVCTRLGGRVDLLTAQAEGVAPSGPWYDAVNQLHREVANIYHYMQGALVNCATAGENDDSAGAAVAQGDINNADRRMRSIDAALSTDVRGRR